MVGNQERRTAARVWDRSREQRIKAKSGGGGLSKMEEPGCGLSNEQK